MKILVFGSGKFYKSKKVCLKGIEILAVLDNATNKQGKVIDGISIVSPEKVQDYAYDFILIMSYYKTEMKNQLINLGVSEKKILDFNQIGKIFPYEAIPVCYNDNCISSTQKEKRILLVSHELSNTGAPIVLFYVAKILKEKGYFPIILSFTDGELRKDIVNSGIAVVIDADINMSNKRFAEWIKDFQLIWLNTISFAYLADELCALRIPVIWWLHEGLSAYQYIHSEDLPVSESSNLQIYGDGRVSAGAYETVGSQKNVRSLLYGIPDFWKKERGKTGRRDLIVFAVIATICRRKAQDIFVSAIKKLSREAQMRAEFWIMGEPLEEEFSQQLKNLSRDYPQIHFLMACDHEGLEQIYKEIDVVVCPSREDPMPVVLAEGMMNYKTCIVSDSTGTADLITDGENGLIFKSEDAEMLAEKMEWVIEHKEKLDGIGKAARRIYEQSFAMDIFVQHIESVLKKTITALPPELPDSPMVKSVREELS